MKSPARCLIPFAAMLGVLACSPALAGEAEYQLVIIEPWNTTYSLATSRVSDLNNLNEVTGCAHTQPLGGPCSFIWTLETGKVEINLAGLINDQGVIAGGNSIRWPDGTLEFLEDDAGYSVAPVDLNNLNQVAGTWGSPTCEGQSEAAVWTGSGEVALLQQEYGIPAADIAYAINDHSEVVGARSFTEECGNHKAFYFNLSTLEYVDLHGILGNTGVTRALDINNHGIVLGSAPHDGAVRSFLWTATEGVTFLPVADGAEPSGGMTAINNLGQVVGSAYVPGSGIRAMIWDESTGTRDLNDITTGIPDNFAIVEAKKINDNGWIIGRGQYGTWSPERAVVLIPIAPPMRADLNGDCTVDLADLNLVLANFGADAPEADTNDDGTVDLADLNAVLADFGQSCP